MVWEERETELKLCKTKDSLRGSMSLSFKYWVSLVFKGTIREKERERERVCMFVGDSTNENIFGAG